MPLLLLLQAVPDGSESVDALIRRLPRAGTVRWTLDGAGEHDADLERMRGLALAGALTDAQWQQALVRTGAVFWREAWPREEPFALGMRAPAWLGQVRITLKPRIGGWRSAEVGDLEWGPMCGHGIDALEYRALYQALGKLPSSGSELSFDVIVQRGDGWEHPPGHRGQREVLWSGPLHIPVRPVPTHDDALPPTRSPAVTAAIRDSLSAGFRRMGSSRTSRRTAFLAFDQDLEARPLLAGTAISLEVEVLRDGKRLEIAHMLCPEPDPRLLAPFGPSSLDLPRVRVIAERRPEELARYTLRVRGRPDHTLRLWTATCYWAGELTLPLAELM